MTIIEFFPPLSLDKIGGCKRPNIYVFFNTRRDAK